MRFATLTRPVVIALLLAFAVGALAAGDKDKKNEYPNATRQEPKLEMSSGDQRQLNKAADLVNDNKAAEAEPLIQKVLEDDRASKYAQSFAHELLGQVYYEQDKSANAIAEYQKAIQIDGLPNNQHFQVLFMVAQLQLQDEKYQDSLATLEQWEKLTGSQTAEEQALKANAYYRLDKYQEAADTMKKALSMTDKPQPSWQQILMGSYFELNQYDQAADIVKAELAKDPNNMKLINNLATIYVQGNKDQQALEVLGQAKAKGLITTSDDYVQLAKLYSVANQPKSAAETMKEGFAKGIIKPGYDTYKLEGDVCTQAEQDDCAIEGYSKAAPLAKDGNIDYQLGYVYYYADKPKDAVDALTRAITKGGLRQEGEAYILRGDAYSALNENAPATADWEKAATFPSTKTMAEQRIRAIKGGVKLKRASRPKTGAGTQ